MAQLTKEDITRWVEALRSGKYKQTQGTLKEKFKDGTFGYCCLGVLESVMGREPDAEERNGTAIEEGPSQTYNRLEDELDCLGIYSSNLITLNDDEVNSFSEIADYIEVHLT